jgi:hypothetical protein
MAWNHWLKYNNYDIIVEFTWLMGIDQLQFIVIHSMLFRNSSKKPERDF